MSETTGTFTVGNFTASSTPIDGKVLVRHIITDTVGGQVVADNAVTPVSLAEFRATTVSIIQRIAERNPTDLKVNPKWLQDKHPAMIAAQVVLWESAKATIASL